MKLKKSSIQQPIFDPNGERAGWGEEFLTYEERLNRPTPPSPQAVKRARFRDKTFVWVHK